MLSWMAGPSMRTAICACCRRGRCGRTSGGMASRLATPTAYLRVPQRRARQPAAQRPRPDRRHASFRVRGWTPCQGYLGHMS